MGRILKIREVGDTILNKVCEDVDINNIDEKILEDIEDMKETLLFSDGFGLAAPQVGINKRIIVIKIEKEKCSYEDSEDFPLTVMINPSYTINSDETNIEFEGCLSVPNVRGKVKRYKNIHLKYYSENGELVEQNLNGFIARDIQHECDHLDGIIFLDKVTGPNGFATTNMIKKYDLRNKENK